MLIYSYLATVLILKLLLMKESIKKSLFKKRMIDCVVVDTGELGKIVFKKDFSTGKFKGIERVYNKERVYNGVIYYESDNVEPLSIEKAINKYQFYCNTNEFDTITNNRLLEKLMYVKEKNLLIIALVLSGISVLGIALLYMKVGDIQKGIDVLISAQEVIQP